LKRISKDKYYLNIAFAVCKRSNCLKRHYGAVIVKDDVIVATGYNGSPRGEENCCDVGFCNRLSVPSNYGDYSGCHSVHAEQNALLATDRSKLIGATLYLAGEEYLEDMIYDVGFVYKRMDKCVPCPICKRMIDNAGIARVVGELNE